MPTYEYRCKACGEDLEVVQAFTDDPLTECPSCGGELRKVFGSVGISFKGSGFYKTDARASSSSRSSSSKDASSSDSSSSDSSASSSKETTKDSSKDSKSSTDSSSTKKSEAKTA